MLLPGLDAKQTPVGKVMTGKPVTIKPDDPLDACMAMMAARGFRHLPVLDASRVVGVISIGDVVKNIIRDLEHNVDDLMGYIMKDGPGADGQTTVPSPCVCLLVCSLLTVARRAAISAFQRWADQGEKSLPRAACDPTASPHFMLQ
ncbi:CBS domain-containing protein [Bradyrhizobium sp. RDM4]|uniref:CBS domain-containing protein n=1 Tax=Bradyrhizobium sp. RDM4 TaxID=3378765 RepID=UPI0038FCBF0C